MVAANVTDGQKCNRFISLAFSYTEYSRNRKRFHNRFPGSNCSSRKISSNIIFISFFFTTF